MLATDCHVAMPGVALQAVPNAALKVAFKLFTPWSQTTPSGAML